MWHYRDRKSGIFSPRGMHGDTPNLQWEKAAFHLMYVSGFPLKRCLWILKRLGRKRVKLFKDSSSLYWILKLHKYSFKQHYIAWSAKCSTKPLSKLLTCVLSAVKTGLQSYCDTSYSGDGVNQNWILKNSKDLLEYIQSRPVSCNSIKTFDFSTLYTTILHF